MKNMNNSTLSMPRRYLAAGSAGVLVAAGSLAVSALPAAAAEGPQALAQSQWQGEPNGTLGFSVSSTSCDINGDGVQDTVLGDWGWDRPGFPNTGAAYVALGSAAAKSGDVADPDLSGTIRIDGPSVTVPGGAWVGWSVSCLGDVNGDSLDDFVLGAGSRNYQQATVIFGQRDFTSVDLDFLGTRGFVIEDPGAADKVSGDKSTDNFGFAVSAAGDADGDGLADIAVGDILADYNDRTNSGRVWIIKGQTSVTNVDVQRDAGKVIRTIDGAAAQDRMGTVSPGGDVNGDGRDDLLVSAYTASPWGTGVASSGAAYAIWGSAGVDLAALGGNGFAVYGPERERDRLGASIAGIGDVNGDGLADLAVGADGASREGAPRNGGVAVVLGSAAPVPVMTDPESDGPTVYTCSTGTAEPDCPAGEMQERGYWIEGAADDSRTGASVAGLPDINADGVPEILIGAAGSGDVWVSYGMRNGSGTVALAGLTAEDGMHLGTAGGTAVGSGADLNADGSPDVVSGGGNAVTMFLLAAAVAAPETPGDGGTPGEGETPGDGGTPDSGTPGSGPDGSGTPGSGPDGSGTDDSGTDDSGTEGASGPGTAGQASDTTDADAGGTPLAATGAGQALPYIAGAALVLLAAGAWLVISRRRRA